MCSAFNTNLQLVSGGFYLCCFIAGTDGIILYVELVCVREWLIH